MTDMGFVGSPFVLFAGIACRVARLLMTAHRKKWESDAVVTVGSPSLTEAYKRLNRAFLLMVDSRNSETSKRAPALIADPICAKLTDGFEYEPSVGVSPWTILTASETTRRSALSLAPPREDVL